MSAKFSSGGGGSKPILSHPSNILNMQVIFIFCHNLVNVQILKISAKMHRFNICTFHAVVILKLKITTPNCQRNLHLPHKDSIA